MRIVREIRDLLFLTCAFFYANKRSLMASSLGLVIALASLSQTVVYLDTIKGKLFVESLKDEGYEHHFDFGLQIEQITPNGDFPSDLLVSHKERLLNAFSSSNKMHYFRDVKWNLEYAVTTYWSSGGVVGSTELPEDRVVQLVGFEDGVFDELMGYLEPDGRIPESSSEVILVVPARNLLTVDTSSQTNLTVKSGANPGVNQSVTASGYLVYNVSERRLSGSQSRSIDLITGWSDTLASAWDDYLLFTSVTYWKEMVTEFKESTGQGYNPIYYVNGLLFLDREVIDVFQVDAELDALNVLHSSLLDTYTEAHLTSISVNPFIIDIFVFVQPNLYSLFTFVVMFSLPIFGIAILLVLYSFGLVKRQKRKVVGLIKTRGMSAKKVRFLLLSENAFSAGLAILASITLSIPLNFVSIKTSGLFEFDNPGFPLVINWIPLMQLVVTLGLFLSLVLHLRFINSLSKISPVQGLEVTDKGSSYWRDKYLDVVFTTAGLVGFIVLVLGSTHSDLPDETYTLVYVLGIPSPFFLIVGLSLLVSRVFPFIFQLLGSQLWKFQGGILSFSWKNLIRHKESALRSVILIMLTTSYAIVALTIPPSLDNYYRINSEYYVGSDIYVPTESFQDVTSGELADLSDFITSVSPVVQQERHVVEGGHTFLGIDPETYLDVATDQFGGLSSPIDSLISSIGEAPNTSVLVHEADLTRLGKKVGDSLVLRSYAYDYDKGAYVEVARVMLEIKGSFRYWPRIVNQLPADRMGLNSILMVGSLDLAQIMSQNLSRTSDRYGYFVKVTEEGKIQEVSGLIDAYFGKSVTTSYFDLYDDRTNTLTWTMSLGILNSDLFILVTVFVIFNAFFILMLLTERRREVAVERSLGMSLGQMTRLFLYEGLAISTFGLSIGVIVGAMTSVVFMFVALLQDLVPPFQVMFNPISYLALICLVLLLNVGAAVIPAVIVSKDRLNNILRVE